VSHDFGRAVQERVVEESRDNAGTQRDLKTVRQEAKRAGEHLVPNPGQAGGALTSATFGQQLGWV
jgi:hypothetical protein